MYEYMDSRLKSVKKKLEAEFAQLGAMGFDALNVVNTKKLTKAMFTRLLQNNETAYLRVAKKAYSDGKKTAARVGFSPDEETDITAEWLFAILLGYNLVTGYLYDKETERKRLRLNEQILTAREFNDARMLRDSIRRSMNLWWTQTQQYGIEVVDEASLQAYADAGVQRIRWVAVGDERTCPECRARHNKIYDIRKVPAKTHYACRCRLEPVGIEE
jgi:SPP1 gp7 family putative phage head morphogenesis protein